MTHKSSHIIINIVVGDDTDKRTINVPPDMPSDKIAERVAKMVEELRGEPEGD